MDKLPSSIPDLVVVAVVLISGLLAFTRGFTKEVLSIAGWIGAAIITLEAFPHVMPYVQAYIHDRLLANAATIIGIFVVSLVVLWLVSNAIARRVQNSHIGALDRSLGFLFGLLRGVVLLSLAYLILAQFVPPSEHPAWLREARATPVIRYGAEALARFTPDNIRRALADGETRARAAGNMAGQMLDAGKAMGAVDRQTEQPDKAGKSGYTSEQRLQLDRIIRSNTEN